MAGIMDKLKQGMSALGKAPVGKGPKGSFPPKGGAPAKGNPFPPKKKATEPETPEEEMEKMQGLK